MFSRAWRKKKAEKVKRYEAYEVERRGTMATLSRVVRLGHSEKLTGAKS